MSEKIKYCEIQKLYDYCKEIGIDATIEPLFDGQAIRFPCGADFVQHFGSYGSACGCVEPAIGCEYDYTAVTLEQAKLLVDGYKERLNRRTSKAPKGE